MERISLSDSFPEDSDPNKSDVQVTVHLYNIASEGDNHLIRGCKPLAEYSWFIEMIRENRKRMGLEPAVDKAIEDMPNDYEIKGFLIGHQAEVRNMCITEYNEAETMQMFKIEGREDQLISQVCRKLRKGKSVEQIADELEEDEVRIKVICDAAEKFFPDYEEEKVSAAIRQNMLV